MSYTDGVQLQEQLFDGGRSVFDAERIPHASPTLFDPRTPGLNASPVGHGGRQAAWFIDADFGRAVLRHYRRGGLVARLSKDRYIWRSAKTTRSFAEFYILARMHSKNLPVPRPLAAAYWRSGISYRAAIMIERIEQARTLTEVIQASGQPDSDVQQEAAHAVFAMH